MILSRTPRHVTTLGAVAALAVTLAPVPPAPSGTPIAPVSHVRLPGPVNAQTTFGWRRPQWQDDFVGPRKRHWRVRGRGVVQNQHGMLTLNTTRRGPVSATLTRKGRSTGRWEIRLRSRQYSTARASYRVITELVPAGGRRLRCGARNVALERYRIGGRRAHHYIRTLPRRQFTDRTSMRIGNDKWHTFAVEVTNRRISWFVDSHVLSSERRPAALSGVPFTVRFTMAARPGKKMNQSRMQMDWLRYFTLQRPNKRSVKAPQATVGRYSRAC